MHSSYSTLIASSGGPVHVRQMLQSYTGNQTIDFPAEPVIPDDEAAAIGALPHYDPNIEALRDPLQERRTVIARVKVAGRSWSEADEIPSRLPRSTLRTVLPSADDTERGECLRLRNPMEEVHRSWWHRIAHSLTRDSAAEKASRQAALAGCAHWLSEEAVPELKEIDAAEVTSRRDNSRQSRPIHVDDFPRLFGNRLAALPAGAIPALESTSHTPTRNNNGRGVVAGIQLRKELLPALCPHLTSLDVLDKKYQGGSAVSPIVSRHTPANFTLGQGNHYHARLRDELANWRGWLGADACVMLHDDDYSGMPIGPVAGLNPEEFGDREAVKEAELEAKGVKKSKKRGKDRARRLKQRKKERKEKEKARTKVSPPVATEPQRLVPQATPLLLRWITERYSARYRQLKIAFELAREAHWSALEQAAGDRNKTAIGNGKVIPVSDHGEEPLSSGRVSANGLQTLRGRLSALCSGPWAHKHTEEQIQSQAALHMDSIISGDCPSRDGNHRPCEHTASTARYDSRYERVVSSYPAAMGTNNRLVEPSSPHVSPRADALPNRARAPHNPSVSDSHLHPHASRHIAPDYSASTAPQTRTKPVHRVVQVRVLQQPRDVAGNDHDMGMVSVKVLEVPPRSINDSLNASSQREDKQRLQCSQSARGQTRSQPPSRAGQARSVALPWAEAGPVPPPQAVNVFTQVTVRGGTLDSHGTVVCDKSSAHRHGLWNRVSRSIDRTRLQKDGALIRILSDPTESFDCSLLPDQLILQTAPSVVNDLASPVHQRMHMPSNNSQQNLDRVRVHNPYTVKRVRAQMAQLYVARRNIPLLVVGGITGVSRAGSVRSSGAYNATILDESDREVEEHLDDLFRVNAMQAALGQLSLAARKWGINCRGFIAEPLLDGALWEPPHSGREGLVFVDRNSLERIPKTSFYWYKHLIAVNNGHYSRYADYIRRNPVVAVANEKRKKAGRRTT